LNNNFHKFIKAVGTGPKHNHNLSKDEMNKAMDMILQNEKSIDILGDLNSKEFSSLLQKCDNCISGASWQNSFLSFDFEELLDNDYTVSINDIKQSIIINQENPDRIIISHKTIQE